MGHGFTDEELSADLDSLFPPAEDAEKLKQALCDDIRESLNRAYLDKIFDSEQNSLPLVDYLSAAIPGNTIASGKEEIENIVEQIYFDMEEWKSLALFQPQPTAEGAEEILEGVMVENGFTYVSFPAFVENESSIDVFDIACKAMTEFATLHAQRLAEKMVEERLREYHLNEGYDIVMVGNPDKEIDGDIFEDIKVAALELSELRGLKVMITGFYANYLKSRDSHEQHR